MFMCACWSPPGLQFPAYGAHRLLQAPAIGPASALQPPWRRQPGCRHAPQQQQQQRTVPATWRCRARLPHMDEELEHLQWQLDKRVHDNSTSAGSGSHKRHHADNRQQLVFHSSKQPRQRHHRPGRGSGSTSSGGATPGDSSSGDEAGVHLMDAGPHQQQRQGYHTLQLGHHAGTHQLRKLQDRLAKHILQDGGCLLAAQVGHASLLTEVLLQLQHRHLHTQQELLLLQPLSCDAAADLAGHSPTALSVSNAAAAAAATAAPQAPAAPSGAGAQLESSRSALPWPGPPEELTLFASFMATEALLGLQGATCSSSTSSNSPPAAGGAVGPHEGQPATTSSPAAAAAGDAGPSSGSSSGSSSSGMLPPSKEVGELLQAASRSSTPSVAAVLAAAADSGSLGVTRVSTHADAAAVAASVVDAAARGRVQCLHVKHHAAAHAVACAALGMAAAGLAASAPQQQVGLGVLLVPGRSHEWLHTAVHGHGAAAAPPDGRHAGAEQQHHVHHGSRVASDESMDVGGFGAAFYGISSWGTRGEQQHGLKHKHAQEVWLCVVPFLIVADEA